MIQCITISVRLNIYNSQIFLSSNSTCRRIQQCTIALLSYINGAHAKHCTMLLRSRFLHMTLHLTSSHFPSSPFRPTTLCPPIQMFLSLKRDFSFA